MLASFTVVSLPASARSRSSWRGDEPRGEHLVCRDDTRESGDTHIGVDRERHHERPSIGNAESLP
jgi:hypothetical protein